MEVSALSLSASDSSALLSLVKPRLVFGRDGAGAFNFSSARDRVDSEDLMESLPLKLEGGRAYMLLGGLERLLDAVGRFSVLESRGLTDEGAVCLAVELSVDLAKDDTD